MADRGRVTITLGRGGQVVKRNGPASDITHTNSMPLAGSKRSLIDRLGSSGSQLDNKRQHGADDRSYQTAKDIGIGRGDLRFKLMQKNSSRQTHGDGNERVIDLREKLSRTVQTQHGSLHARQRMPEPEETSILRRIPYSRSTEDLSQMDSSRSSYSSWTTDHLRRRSPDGMLGSSRAHSPLRRKLDEPQRRPLSRSYDVVRSVPFMSKDVHEVSLPTCSVSPFMTKPALHTRYGKPVTSLMGQLPPPGGLVQQRPYGFEEQHTVDGLLSALGLGKYAVLFKVEEVDMTALKQMGEKDLKDLGIPMGPRKNILLALARHSKRQQGPM